MGFFDREVRNSMDRMFDYNRDGFLNCGEQAMEYQYMEELSSPSESDRRIAGFSESALFDDDDDSESGLSISELSDLSDRTGLSITELELMDENEIEDALEEARDDWDDDFEDHDDWDSDGEDW